MEGAYDASGLRGQVSDLSPFAQVMLPFLADPYPMYEALRPLAPLRWDLTGMWAVLSYEHAVVVLRDTAFVPFHPRNSDLDLLRLDPADPALALVREELDHQIQFMSGEQHARTRRLTSPVFVGAAVDERRASAREMTQHVLDVLLPQASVDLVQDIAAPVPLFTAARALGLPQDDWPTLLQWADPISRWLEMFVSPVGFHESVTAFRQARAYFDDVFASREPGDDPSDPIVQLIRQERDGLRREDGVGLCLHALAGSVSTRSLVANTVVALARHPDQWALVRADPRLVAAAIEETLRWDPPLQAVIRRATRPVSIGDTEVQAGDGVMVVIAAANRDPARFRDPATFDVTRHSVRHLGMGLGAHFCNGADVGRATAVGVIEVLAERIERLELDPAALKWEETLVPRRLETAPLQLHAGAT